MSYVFDFNAEVARARAEYPEATKGVPMFLLPEQAGELSRFLTERNGPRWEALWTATVHDFHEFVENHDDPLPVKVAKLRVIEGPDKDIAQIEEFIRLVEDVELEAANTGSCVFPGNPYRPAMVIVKPETGSILDNPHKTAFYHFWHELGHIVVPGASGGRNPVSEGEPGYWDNIALTRGQEERADVFSLLQGLRRGILDREDVRDVSDNRLYGLLYKGEDHYTSPVVDTINMKIFSQAALSPRRIALLATAMPALAPLPGEALERLSSMLDGGRKFLPKREPAGLPGRRLNKETPEERQNLRCHFRSVLEKCQALNDLARIAVQKLDKICAEAERRATGEGCEASGVEVPPAGRPLAKKESVRPDTGLRVRTSVNSV